MLNTVFNRIHSVVQLTTSRAPHLGNGDLLQLLLQARNLGCDLLGALL